MKTLKLFLLVTIFIVLATPNVFAYNYGNNITISDKVYTGSDWYSNREDQEVEPNCLTGQKWDLERFYLKGNMLTMVGGYNFKDGEEGWTRGDIFIDINGDAKYGPVNTGSGSGNTPVNDRFNYEYAIRLNWVNGSKIYDVYALNANTSVYTVYYAQNDEANPWQIITTTANLVGSGNFVYSTGLADEEGLQGSSHNAVSGIDLSFLAPGTQFIAHFTYKCGNDNLMGEGRTQVPEPTSLLLLGLGLLGIGIMRRKQ